jgi:hypothetical protein
MGTWGIGNLESDGAQDTLAGICDDLFSRVIELLQHPRAHEYDDEEIGELFVRIEMIFALSERGMVNSSPVPEELQVLFEPYLQRWTDYHRRAGHDLPVDRLEIMKKSFARLEEIAGGASKGSFIHRIGLISEIMSKPKPPRESAS